MKVDFTCSLVKYVRRWLGWCPKPLTTKAESTTYYVTGKGVWLKGYGFFVAPFVLLMSWYLVTLTFSPYFHSYVLGHYELTTTKPLNPTLNEAISVDNVNPSAPAYMVWVANDTIEVLERVTTIIGLETLLSAIISFIIYKAAKESLQ